MRWFAFWMMVKILLQLMRKSKQLDNQFRRFPRNATQTEMLRNAQMDTSGTKFMSSVQVEMINDKFLKKDGSVKSFQRSVLSLNKTARVRLFQVCNIRGILQVWLLKCVVLSVASPRFRCGWTAGCAPCPSPLCSHPTPLLPRQASRSALSQHPVKMGRLIYEEQAPFFCRTKVDGPSPALPPGTPTPPDLNHPFT